MLYLIEILHQTTTVEVWIKTKTKLYLIEILHQTTTVNADIRRSFSCILSKFYIKPQHGSVLYQKGGVVSYRNSTSNHNAIAVLIVGTVVVSYRNSTSNHNLFCCVSTFYLLYLIEILHQTTTSSESFFTFFMLYLIEILHQTTTTSFTTLFALQLYLIEILHQTTTTRLSRCLLISCILSKFYIKPQLRDHHP